MNVLNCKKKTDKQRAYDEGYNQGLRDATEYMLYSYIQFFGDERGWKTESILKGIKRIHRKATMILEDYTTYEEVKEAVKEEYGIVIEDGQVKFDSKWIKE